MSIVTVIDTGISFKFYETNLLSKVIKQYEYDVIKNNISETLFAEDEIGHGTMICSAMNTINKNINYNIIKIFGNSIWADEEILIKTLEYIYNNIKTDIVHISFGINFCEEIDKLNAIIKKLKANGIIIVAAFSNNQTISYPAACYDVIGVMFDNSIIKTNEWIYVENSLVNVFATGQPKNLISNDGKMKLVAGSSFAAAYISGHISKLIDNKHKIDVKTYLKENAKCVYLAPDITNNLKKFDINRIVIFPFNKENHSLIRNHNMLIPKIHSVLDVKYSINIGKKVFEILDINDKKDDFNHLTVKDIMKLDWNENFDTFILGHIENINSLLTYSLYDYIIDMCIKYNKNIYTYDSLSKAQLDKIRNSAIKINYPNNRFSNIYENRIGMLYEISKPVVGVFGTSSKQGKWTLQLKIREMLEKIGYTTGHLGTEPSAELFKNTTMAAIGFNSTIDMKSNDAISLFNYQMHLLEKNSDLLIFGTQSNVIPLSFGGISTIPRYTNELIYACEPQASILCINEWDDIDYVEKCISYLESFYDNKVICLAYISKKANYNRWDKLGMHNFKISSEKNKIFEYAENKKIPIVKMDDDDEIKKICEIIINYF